MNKIVEKDVNLNFTSSTGVSVVITNIQYGLDGQKDYDEGIGGGLTLLNKQVFSDGQRIDRDPQSVQGWINLMNEVDEFLFNWIENNEKGGEIPLAEQILNLTQHVATPDQVAANVVEPMNKEEVQQLLTFNSLPSRSEINLRARELARIARIHGVQHVMIGGAPYLMPALETALVELGLIGWYAFSDRVSVETPDGNGGVRKTNVFKHAGFIPATN